MIQSHSKYMDDIKEHEMMLGPAELARALGVKSATAMNELLAIVGFQRRIDGVWTPTEEGEKVCFRHGWTKNGKSGRNIKWKVEVVRAALDDESDGNDNLMPLYPSE